MNITVVNTLSEDEWAIFVENHPEGNIFHTPEMFQVFSQTKGFRPELWAATNNGRVLAMLMPVKITLMNGLLRYFTTRSVALGSVLCLPNAEGQEALSQLLQTYRRETDGTSLFTELRNLSDLKAVQLTLREQGFVYEDHLNYLVNLERPPEAVFENFGRRTRKNIRRGLRQGEVVIEEVKEWKHLAACYDLIRHTYRAADVPLADFSLFKAAFDLLYPKRMVRFTLARVGQTPIAASVELLYKDVIYGWYGGMDRTYSSYGPSELVMWDILKWGAENGYRVYDFGGAGSPDEEYGVRDFKAKFGGELVCFGRNICVHAPLSLGLSKLGYRVLRRSL